jgi:hypothetical protein
MIGIGRERREEKRREEKGRERERIKSWITN